MDTTKWFISNEGDNSYKFFSTWKLLNNPIDFDQMLSVKIGNTGPSDDYFTYKVSKNPLND